MIKRVEYYPTGQIKSIEYWPATAAPVHVPMPAYPWPWAPGTQPWFTGNPPWVIGAAGSASGCGSSLADAEPQYHTYTGHEKLGLS